jgi:methionyl-tRNA synthetase
MFLPDRYIKGECPKCGAKDQYGDACEVCGAVYAPTDLKNPYSTLTGATPGAAEQSSTTSSGCPTRAASSSCASGPAARRPAAARGGATRPRVARRRRRTGGLGDWDISRDAPYFGIPIPDAPGKYFYVWLDAPIGYLASLKNTSTGKAKAHLDFDGSSPTRRVEQIHFIGKDIIYFHTLFWPAMLQVLGPQGAGQHLRARLHHGQRREDEQVRGTGISPAAYLELGMNPEWLRYYIAAKLNAAGRGRRLQSRRLRRARQQRPGRQVRQHREPRGRLPGQAFDGRLSMRRGLATRAARSTEPRSGADIGRRALLRNPRLRQGAARDHGLRRPRQPVRSTSQALGARQAGPRAGATLQASARSASRPSRLLTVWLKPVLPALAARPKPSWATCRSAELAEDAHRAAAAATGSALPAPDAAGRSEACSTLFEPPAAARRRRCRGGARAARQPPVRAKRNGRRRHKPHRPPAPEATPAGIIGIDDFVKVDLRIARIVNCRARSKAPTSCCA